MIQIYKDFFIDADANCFMLREKKTLTNKKTQEEYDNFTTLGYYSSLAGLYRGFIRVVERDAIMDERVQTLGDFIESMDDLFSALHNIISALEDLKSVYKDDEDDG
jgi:hypothetical protein